MHITHALSISTDFVTLRMADSVMVEAVRGDARALETNLIPVERADLHLQPAPGKTPVAKHCAFQLDNEISSNFSRPASIYKAVWRLTSLYFFAKQYFHFPIISADLANLLT